MTGSKLFGLVEAGGTKFVLGLARSKDEILATTRIETSTPDKTLGAMVRWFEDQAVDFGQIDGIGIASFGPLQLDKSAPDWGCITQTPKPHWSGADLAGPLAAAFGCNIAIDTDVNGAALAEYHWGAGRGHNTVLYLTIGTGIGGGAVIDGKILQGVSHPEMGHMRVALHQNDTGFAGNCPIHGNCLEGLASGPAIIKRWGASLSELPADHPAKVVIAHYLAQTMCTLQSIFEPGRIILGGGVMASEGLIDMVRQEAVKLGGGYFVSDASEIVQMPGLGTDAGLLGALALIDRSA
ncbi:MAG: ROK family protein [Pontixanthobacter sp.]